MLLALLVAGGITLACGASSEASPELPNAVDAGGSVDASFGSDSSAPDLGSGIVVLHSAVFPAFRLCFSNYPELPPLPDRTVMPAANVVGVEVGSAVRLDALPKAPGTVYVIDQANALATPNASARSCGDLIESGALRPRFDYLEAGEIQEPLGVGQVSLLAITGCGTETFLAELNQTKVDCGTDWVTLTGNLKAVTRRLEVSPAATAKTTLPVRIINASPFFARFIGGGTADLSFGTTDAIDPSSALPQHVATVGSEFEVSEPVSLELASSSEAAWGTHKLRLLFQRAASAGPPLKLDQSLAVVQELSDPLSSPEAYFHGAPASHVLLLVGDPSLESVVADASVVNFARRSLHFVAIPVAAEISEPIVPVDASADAN